MSKYLNLSLAFISMGLYLVMTNFLGATYIIYSSYVNQPEYSFFLLAFFALSISIVSSLVAIHITFRLLIFVINSFIGGLFFKLLTAILRMEGTYLDSTNIGTLFSIRRLWTQDELFSRFVSCVRSLGYDKDISLDTTARYVSNSSTMGEVYESAKRFIADQLVSTGQSVVPEETKGSLLDPQFLITLVVLVAIGAAVTYVAFSYFSNKPEPAPAPAPAPEPVIIDIPKEIKKAVASEMSKVKENVEKDILGVVARVGETRETKIDAKILTIRKLVDQWGGKIGDLETKVGDCKKNADQALDLCVQTTGNLAAASETIKEIGISHFELKDQFKELKADYKSFTTLTEPLLARTFATTNELSSDFGTFSQLNGRFLHTLRSAFFGISKAESDAVAQGTVGTQNYQNVYDAAATMVNFSKELRKRVTLTGNPQVYTPALSNPQAWLKRFREAGQQFMD